MNDNNNDNYLNSESHNNDFSTTELKNKGFLLLDEVFKQYGWMLTKNEKDHITYAKSNMDPNIFDIKVERTSVSVTIPLKKSNYLYNTTFTSYFEASEYVEERLKDYLSSS